jgi:Glycosyl transferases group 1
VTFLGEVADATAFLRSGAVVPLVSRAGTGTQLKSIETFELGLPAVTTTRSLRGICHLPENCIVADDPVGFANALLFSAKSAAKDADGRIFFERQRTMLDSAVSLGLAKLEATGRRAAT